MIMIDKICKYCHTEHTLLVHKHQCEQACFARLKKLEWDKYFLQMARLVSTKSKDQSTKCGCVITKDNAVISTGYNGLCAGMEYTDNVQVRPYKYLVFEHSERNAVYLAAKLGTSLNGSKAYVTGPPCADCARALVQSGVKEVYWPVKHNFITRMDQWKESCATSLAIFRECGIHWKEVEIDS